MGIFDQAKDAISDNSDKIEQAVDKAKDVLADNADKVGDVVDKAAAKVDDLTGGKFSEHIAAGAEKAQDLLGGSADGSEAGGGSS